MAKDPAFLFYPGDWLGGTMTFSRFHKGAYMDLLMCQFNHGHMALHVVATILGEKDFLEMWESTLKAKFKVDSDGKFYNQKLEDEIFKRRKFTKSRQDNLNKNKPQVDSHTGNHTGPRMENENYNGNGNVFVFDLKMELPEPALESAQLNQFTLTKKKNTEFIKSQWKVFLSERMNDPPEKKIQYRKVEDLTSYFLNWIRNKAPKNGNEYPGAASNNNGKLGTSDARVDALKKW